MSVETQEADSSDVEQSEEIPFEDAVEEVLDELPDRFEELSKTTDREQIILTPSSGRQDSHGDEGSIVFGTASKAIVESHGFSFHFISRADVGAGINFWYEYDA